MDTCRALCDQLGVQLTKDKTEGPATEITFLRRVKVSPTKQKMPITLLVLQMIHLQLDLSQFDNVMLWAECTTAFFGFLRAAEFTTPPEGFSQARHLSLGDVTI